MNGLWIGLGVVAVSVAWLGWELYRAPLMVDDDVWGCDECTAEAAELQRGAMLRHPSSRTTCPDFVPDWL